MPYSSRYTYTHRDTHTRTHPHTPLINLSYLCRLFGGGKGDHSFIHFILFNDTLSNQKVIAGSEILRLGHQQLFRVATARSGQFHKCKHHQEKKDTGRISKPLLSFRRSCCSGMLFWSPVFFTNFLLGRFSHLHHRWYCFVWLHIGTSDCSCMDTAMSSTKDFGALNSKDDDEAMIEKLQLD